MDIFYPKVCPICQEPLGRDRNGECYTVCVDCREGLVDITDMHCLKCGKELLTEGEYCHDCQTRNHIYTQGVAVFRYTQGMKQSIYRYKYKNKREYAAFYGKEMYRVSKDLLRLWNIDAIVPVPLHESKQRMRGYNQAELMARELSAYTGIPMVSNMLLRARKTTPMKELDDKQRVKNLKNAFIISQNIVNYRKVLLVDDIYTTGATMDACAKCLKAHGVSDVYFVCLCIGQGF